MQAGAIYSLENQTRDFEYMILWTNVNYAKYLQGGKVGCEKISWFVDDGDVEVKEGRKGNGCCRNVA